MAFVRTAGLDVDLSLFRFVNEEALLKSMPSGKALRRWCAISPREMPLS